MPPPLHVSHHHTFTSTLGLLEGQAEVVQFHCRTARWHDSADVQSALAPRVAIEIGAAEPVDAARYIAKDKDN
jgi:hypothetical protein